MIEVAHLLAYCAAWAGAALLSAAGLPALGVMLGLLMVGVLLHRHRQLSKG